MNKMVQDGKMPDLSCMKYMMTDTHLFFGCLAPARLQLASALISSLPSWFSHHGPSYEEVRDEEHEGNEKDHHDEEHEGNEEEGSEQDC